MKFDWPRRLADDLATFVRQYGRKRPRGNREPDDRDFDRRLQLRTRRMDPTELDALLRDDVDESESN